MSAYCSLVAAYLFILQPIPGALPPQPGWLYQSHDACEIQRKLLTDANKWRCTAYCAVAAGVPMGWSSKDVLFGGNP